MSYTLPTVKFSSSTIAKKIPVPEFKQPAPGTSGLGPPMLVFIDDTSLQRSAFVDAPLFREAAGRNAEGDIPSGMDRILDATYDILFEGEKDEFTGFPKAVGINVMHTRSFRRNMIPLSLKDVTTVRIDFSVGGAVWTIKIRPPKMPQDEIRRIMRTTRKAASDALATKKATMFRKGDTIDGVGVIEDISNSFVEIRPKKIQNTSGDLDSIQF